MDTGKKEIVVTIREFLENGGKLTKGRYIYTMDADSINPWPIGTYLGWDNKLDHPLVSNRSFKTMPISIENKIMIEVKPIWK